MSTITFMNELVSRFPESMNSVLFQLLRRNLELSEEARPASPRSKSANLAANLRGKFPICPKC